MEADIRVGLAGLGRHGMRYARHLADGDVPGVSLSRVWTRDPDKRDRVADALDVQAADGIAALAMSGQVDAMVAAVPAGLHLEVALAAAAGGKPLLLEKPLARTVDEGQRICRAFEDSEVELMVAQTLRFDPLLKALEARSGSVGRLVGFSFEQRLEPRGLAWEDDPDLAGGGVLLQTAIHTVDAVRFCTGATHLRVVHAARGRVQAAHNEDVGLVHLEARLGGDAASILGDVRVSKIGGSRHMRFALYGEAAGLEADFIDRCLVETRGRDRTRLQIAEQPTVPTALAAFAAMVRGEADNPIPGPVALESLRVVREAYAAAGGGASQPL